MERVVFRLPAHLRLQVILGSLVIGGVVPVIVREIPHRGSLPELITAVVLAGSVLTISFGSSTTLTPDGIHLRWALLHTRFIPWYEVRGILVPPGDLRRVMVMTASGPRVLPMVSSSRGAEDPEFAAKFKLIRAYRRAHTPELVPMPAAEPVAPSAIRRIGTRLSGIWQGVLAALLLFLVAAGSVPEVLDDRRALDAYRSAPACSLEDARPTHCRWTVPVIVDRAGKGQDNGTYVQLELPSRGPYTLTLPTRVPAIESFVPGSSVTGSWVTDQDGVSISHRGIVHEDIKSPPVLLARAYGEGFVVALLGAFFGCWSVAALLRRRRGGSGLRYWLLPLLVAPFAVSAVPVSAEVPLVAWGLIAGGAAALASGLRWWQRRSG